jgi:poly(A) polymerase
MTAPRIVPRQEHPISRRNIDPDALKVLYRLKESQHIAYLVGGSVRDLLLGRHPKDFDIGTSAHPYQVKRLFRNCWIIGRRFRLAHVRFGQKVIEVATFRRQLVAGEEVVQDGVPAPDPSTPQGELLIHRDNTFGTPEEDAFRRDFTINALFYDIATFSVIDYVGGLEDLAVRIVRSIGNPDERVREDPVRMLRAIALAARLDFTIDPPILDAIRKHHQEIARSSAPRLLEEYYKILRAGSSEKAFRGLKDLGLLEPVSTELHRGATDSLWRALANLDTYRRRFESTPETLTNAIVLGTLLVGLGIPLDIHHRDRPDHPDRDEDSDHRERRDHRTSRNRASDGQRRGHSTGPRLGELPLARRDLERLRQILGLQRRLHDLSANPRAQRALLHKHVFREALTWLEIQGGSPETTEHWKSLLSEAGPPVTVPGTEGEPVPFRRHRRRRRRRRLGDGVMG